MTRGLIVLAHGSKRIETKETLAAIVKMIKAKSDFTHVEEAYLQFCKPTLEDAVQQMFARNIMSSIVAPYFLFKGLHNTEDIPEEINRLKSIYPGLELTLAEPLGVDERMAEILIERAQEVEKCSI